MKLVKNQRGYFTVESAIIMPMLLIVTSIVVIFFYFFIQYGAFHILFNHRVLAEELNMSEVQSLEMMKDDHTTVEVEDTKEIKLDEFRVKTVKAKATSKSPIFDMEQVLEGSKSRLSMPFFYEVIGSKYLGSGMETIRGKLGL